MKQFLSLTVMPLFFIVMLSGCGGASPSPDILQKDAQRVWVENPPSDSSKYYYAIGEGATQEDAKNNALSDVASRIMVSVSSSFASNVSVTRDNNDEQAVAKLTKDVTAKVQQIEFTDVRVEERFQDRNQWIVLLKVDRQKLFQTYLRKLDENDKKAEAEWNAYTKGSIFEKLKLSRDVKNLLKEADSLFPILHALNQSFDDTAYKNKYRIYFKDMRELKSNMVIAINADKNSESLAKLMREYLSRENMKFSKSNANVNIYVSTTGKQRNYKTTNAKLANMYFALRTTVIKAKNEEGQVVSSNVIKTKASSSQSFEDTFNQTKPYEKMIQKNGILAFIIGE